MAILPDLTELSREDLIAQIEAMRKASSTKLSMKVSASGGLSVYGLGRFPVTLYKSQWERLLNEREAILAFLKANASVLTTKAAA